MSYKATTNLIMNYYLRSRIAEYIIELILLFSIIKFIIKIRIDNRNSLIFHFNNFIIIVIFFLMSYDFLQLLIHLIIYFDLRIYIS
jgi:hypothetical protein